MSSLLVLAFALLSAHPNLPMTSWAIKQHFHIEAFASRPFTGELNGDQLNVSVTCSHIPFLIHPSLVPTAIYIATVDALGVTSHWPRTRRSAEFPLQHASGFTVCADDVFRLYCRFHRAPTTTA
ncbi:hypothetical protein FB451DRAFT_1533605 [Mycena latifolia]|nr:hypothetical protein FB451DRAFT_1533605 [Mycena latifolia]